MGHAVEFAKTIFLRAERGRRAKHQKERTPVATPGALTRAELVAFFWDAADAPERARVLGAGYDFPADFFTGMGGLGQGGAAAGAAGAADSGTAGGAGGAGGVGGAVGEQEFTRAVVKKFHVDEGSAVPSVTPAEAGESFGPIIRHPGNRAVLLKFVLTTVAMVGVPIGGYFLGERVLFAGMEKSKVWSGVLSVVLVNCIMACYVIFAFVEDSGGGGGGGGAAGGAAGAAGAAGADAGGVEAKKKD